MPSRRALEASAALAYLVGALAVTYGIWGRYDGVGYEPAWVSELSLWTLTPVWVGIAFNLPLTWLPALVLGLAVRKAVERRASPRALGALLALAGLAVVALSFAVLPVVDYAGVPPLEEAEALA